MACRCIDASLYRFVVAVLSLCRCEGCRSNRSGFAPGLSCCVVAAAVAGLDCPALLVGPAVLAALAALVVLVITPSATIRADVCCGVNVGRVVKSPRAT